MAKLVRKTPSLKSQGAKYSVTNRKGETSYYASSKDVDAGKAPISKVGGSGSNTDLMGQSQTLLDQARSMTIGTKDMQANPLMPIPDKPPVSPVGDVTGAFASAMGIKTDSKGFYTPPQQTQQETGGLLGVSQLIQELQSQVKPPSQTDLVLKSREYKDQQRAQQDLNSAQAELNNIIAKRDADILSVVGQGRGIPEAIIGGQQAQLEREAAIRALPVQAKVAAAQGNLEMAKANLQLMSTLRLEDAKLNYQHNMKMLDTVSSFITKAEEREYEALKTQRQREYDVEQNLIKTQTDVMTNALSNGAPTAVITAIQNARTPQEAIKAAGNYIGALDRKLKEAELAKRYKEISLLGEKTETQKKEEEVEIKNTEASVDIARDKITLIDALKKHEGMAGTVGAYGLARFTPFSIDKAEQRDFIGSVDSLTNGLTLDNLIEAKARGATFGALTTEELRLLANSATKINSWRLQEDGRTYGYEASEEDFTKELDNIQRLTRKALVQSGEKLLDDEEANLLDSVFGGTTQFDPSAYFSTSSGT